MTGFVTWRLPAAALTGLLYFLGFIGIGWWPLIFIFLVPLLLAIDGVQSGWRVLLLGEVAGACAMTGGYYWVVHLLQVFAGLSLAPSVLGLFLLTLWHGGILALTAWLVERVPSLPRSLSLPVVLIVLESGYPFLFPNYAGNALYAVPVLTQHVELFGMAGTSALLGFVNGACFDIIRAWRQPVGSRRTRVMLRSGLGVVGVLGAVIAYGAVRIWMVDAAVADAETMKVALIQTNLGANDMNRRRDQFISTHQRMTARAVEEHPDLDLVVWPESGYNRSIPRNRTDLDYVSGTDQVPLLFGAITYEYEDVPGQDRQERHAYNSAILTSSTGAVLSRFDKVKLLMFGETLPFVESYPQVKKLFPRSGTLTRGKELKHMRLGDVRLLPMICYEDLLPGLVRMLWKEDGPADVLVNITNDSWYGDTHEPLTHLALATFRTIETRRAMIRSTNTGISAIVDPVGRIAQRTGQWERETLVAEVPVVGHDGSTLFMRVGNVLGWICLPIVGWWAWPRRRS